MLSVNYLEGKSEIPHYMAFLYDY